MIRPCTCNQNITVGCDVVRKNKCKKPYVGYIDNQSDYKKWQVKHTVWTGIKANGNDTPNNTKTVTGTPNTIHGWQVHQNNTRVTRTPNTICGYRYTNKPTGWYQHSTYIIWWKVHQHIKWVYEYPITKHMVLGTSTIQLGDKHPHNSMAMDTPMHQIGDSITTQKGQLGHNMNNIAANRRTYIYIFFFFFFF